MLPACPGAESTINDPRPGEKKMTIKTKKHMYEVYIVTRFPFGMFVT